LKLLLYIYIKKKVCPKGKLAKKTKKASYKHSDKGNAIRHMPTLPLVHFYKQRPTHSLSFHFIYMGPK